MYRLQFNITRLYIATVTETRSGSDLCRVFAIHAVIFDLP